MTFVDLLNGLITGALTVPIVSWILNQLPADTTTNAKIILAYVVSFALGTGGFFVLAWYLSTPLPTTPQEYINALWPVWAAAFAASQAVLRVAKAVGWAK